MFRILKPTGSLILNIKENDLWISNAILMYSGYPRDGRGAGMPDG